MKLIKADAAQARQTLRNLGMEPMEGASNPHGEFWLSESGDHFFLPYFYISDPDSIVQNALDEYIQKII